MDILDLVIVSIIHEVCFLVAGARWRIAADERRRLVHLH